MKIAATKIIINETPVNNKLMISGQQQQQHYHITFSTLTAHKNFTKW